MKFLATGRAVSSAASSVAYLRPFPDSGPPFSEAGTRPGSPRDAMAPAMAPPMAPIWALFYRIFASLRQSRAKYASVRKPYYLHIQTHVSKAAARPKTIKKSMEFLAAGRSGPEADPKRTRAPIFGLRAPFFRGRDPPREPQGPYPSRYPPPSPLRFRAFS